MKAFDTAKRNTHTKDNEALKLIKNQKDFPFTLDMLKAVFNNATTEQESILQEMVDELNRFVDNDIQMYKTYKLDTRDRLEHFWAQCVGEVGAGLNFLTESLNYDAERLKREKDEIINGEKRKRAPFSYFFSHHDEADMYGKDSSKNTHPDKTADQEMIANLVYADENRGERYKLGNIQEGDGYKYRGRGIKQLTDRTHYTNFSRYAYEQGLVSTNTYFVDSPKEVADNAKFALYSALWYWIDNKIYLIADKSKQASDNEDIVTSVTKKNKPRT